MKIRMPATRACYPASRNEPDRLLCWIPRHELEQLAAEGRVKPEVLEYYPSGLEVRLSRQGFEEFGLDLGVDPKQLYEAYRALRQANALPASGTVAGAHLEQVARGVPLREVLSLHGAAAPQADSVPGVDHALREVGTLPEPEWTVGEDARAVMGRLG
jgi:hypothetical protein